MKSPVLILFGWILYIISPGRIAAQQPSANNKFIASLLGNDSSATSTVLLLITPGECEKCVGLIDEGFDCANERLSGDSIKIVAVVHCARSAEMRVFAKNYGWKHPMVLDGGSVRDSLSLPYDARLAIYSKNYKSLVGVIRSEELSGSICARIAALLTRK